MSWTKTALTISLLLFHLSLSFEIDYDEDELRPSWSRCPWIRNKLKNGRVKIRSRGRIAKFLCNSGYELVGKRYATCVRGQWNSPIPHCVSRGCYKLQEPSNGKVTEMYGGAMLAYDCFPGYVLRGSNTLYCDGNRWSDPTPVCEVAIAQPQPSCDFEDPDLCGWSHDPTHDFDWRRNQFSTPSGHVGTGPSYDHTFGKGKGGFYMYEEASSPRKENDTARLFSPVYPSLFSPGCFVFWYHMYGATTGGLRVFVKPESHVFGELFPSWEKFGDQGNQWLRGNVSIPAFSENFQIIIEGIRGSSYVGDTAIDDVSLTQTDCSSLESINTTTTEAALDSCRGRCREEETSALCGCSEECYVNNSCCSDYAKICTTGNDSSAWDVETAEELLTTNPVATIVESKTEIYNTLMTQIPSEKGTMRISYIVSSTQLPLSAFPSKTTATSSTLRIPSSTVLQHKVPEKVSYETTTGFSPTKAFMKSSSILSSSTMPEIITFNTTVKKTTMTPTTVFQITSMFPTTTKSKTLIPTTFSTKSPTSTETPTKPVFVSSVKSFRNTESTETQTSSVSKNNIYANTVSVSKSQTEATTPITIVSGPRQHDTTIISTKMPSKLSSSTRTATASSVTPFSNTFADKLTTAVMQSPTIEINKSTFNLSTASTTNIPAVVTKTINSNLNFSEINQEITSTKLDTTVMTATSYFQFHTKPRPVVVAKTTKSSTPKKFTISKVRIITLNSNSQRTTTKIPKFSSKVDNVDTKVYPSNSAAVATSNSSSSSSVVGATIGILILLCLIGGVAYIYMRHRSKMQRKLSDDSEIRFLSDNEVLEFSDASAFDKIMLS